LVLNNFPKVNFTMILSGRFEAKWCEMGVNEEKHENYESETMYIRDFLDEQRIEDLYYGKSIVDHKITCISDSATVVIVDRAVY
jgi:hypothetical protein